MLLYSSIQYDPRVGVRSSSSKQDAMLVDKKRATDMGDSNTGKPSIEAFVDSCTLDEMKISPVLSLEDVHKEEENYLRSAVSCLRF